MPYTQVSLADLRADLSRRYDGVPFWVTQEADDAINEALRVWNLLTGMWKRRELTATVAATSTSFPTGYVYALSSTMVYDVRVEWNQIPLSPSSIFDLNNGRTNWRREVTTAGGTVPDEVNMWAPVGLQRIAIWPGAPVGGTLTVDGVRETPTLTVAGDFVDLGRCEIGTLIGYALHNLAFKLGGPAFQSTIPLYTGFIGAAGDLNARLRSSTWYRKVMGLDLQRWQRPIKVPTGLGELTAGPAEVSSGRS